MEHPGWGRCGDGTLGVRVITSRPSKWLGRFPRWTLAAVCLSWTAKLSFVSISGEVFIETSTHVQWCWLQSPICIYLIPASVAPTQLLQLVLLNPIQVGLALAIKQSSPNMPSIWRYLLSLCLLISLQCHPFHLRASPGNDLTSLNWRVDEETVVHLHNGHCAH